MEVVLIMRVFLRGEVVVLLQPEEQEEQDLLRLLQEYPLFMVVAVVEARIPSWEGRMTEALEVEVKVVLIQLAVFFSLPSQEQMD
jgi:hypothetical protein